MAKLRGNLTGKRFNVPVTQEIIDSSTEKSSSHCMIAEAVKQTVPNAKFVSVDIQTIRFTDAVTRLRHTYLTPRNAQHAIIGFDEGRKPKPFNIALRDGLVTAGRSQAVAEYRRKLRKPRIKRSNRGSGAKARRVGGRPPPKTRMFARREFGLRAYGTDK